MDIETVKLHLFRFGFVENYFVWKYQGEKEVISEIASDLPGGTQPGLGDNPYRQMVLDVAGSNFGQGSSSQCYRNIEPESSYHYEPSMEEVPVFQWKRNLILINKGFMICYNQLIENCILVLPSLNSH